MTQRRKKKGALAPEQQKKDVDPRLVKADDDLKELLQEFNSRESTPIDSRRTPFEEEMDSLHSSGRGRIKGRSL